MAHYEQQRRLFDGSRRREVQQHTPQHCFCPQPHYGGPASGIWCERCGRAGHEAKMCAAREPRRFNGLCGSCSELGHLSCHCLLRRDRIYSDVPIFPPHRRSTVAAAAAPATIYQCRPRHTAVAAAAPAMISRGPRRSTAVATTTMVPTRVRSSSMDAAPMVARGTLRHLRSSSQPPAPPVALDGTRGTLAAMDRR